MTRSPLNLLLTRNVANLYNSVYFLSLVSFIYPFISHNDVNNRVERMIETGIDRMGAKEKMVECNNASKRAN